MSLDLEEAFKREETFRLLIQSLRRTLIILSVFPEDLVVDVTTSLMYLGAGILQVETIERFPEIAEEYIEEVEEETYYLIEDLEILLHQAVNKLREENVFERVSHLLKDQDSLSYDEVLTSIPEMEEIFKEIEEKVRELI